MDQWEVRWRAPAQAVVTLDDIVQLPLSERPAVVLPLCANIKIASAEVTALAKIFPHIFLTIDGSAPNDPYTSQILQHARHGYAIRDGEHYHTVTFSVKNDGNWTPEQACQLLTRITITIGNNGIVEQFFPHDLPARMIARQHDGAAWRDAATRYRTNKNLRLYSPITSQTLALNATIALADGVILEPGTEATPEMNAIWRGTVVRTTYGGER